MDVFGDRWSLIIIRDIMFGDKRYYSDFLRSAEGISTNILADRLSHLEQEGILSKTRDTKDRKKYVYELTPKGLDLLPMMMEMVQWSGQHDPNTGVTSAIIDKLGHEPCLMEQEMRKKIAERKQACQQNSEI